MEALEMNKLHNAEIALELCRATLAQHGQDNTAQALRGMELHSVDAARIALGVLQSVRVIGYSAGRAKADAVQALEQAISSQAPYGDA